MRAMQSGAASDGPAGGRARGPGARPVNGLWIQFKRSADRSTMTTCAALLKQPKLLKAAPAGTPAAGRGGFVSAPPDREDPRDSTDAVRARGDGAGGKQHPRGSFFEAPACGVVRATDERRVS